MWLHKNYFFLLGPIIIIIGSVFYFNQTNLKKNNLNLDQTSTTSVAITSPDVTIKNFTFKEYEKNRTYALIVNALDGNFFHATNTITCKTITCTIVNNNNNREIAHIKAERALIKRASKEIFFQGPIHGNFKDIFLESSDIRYNFSSQILTTEKQTRYYHAHAFFSAQKSSVNIKDSSIVMQGGVYSEFFTEPRDMQPTR